ncbi:AraC family transcriptional regulator [Oscillospiraceae bacterium HV4-5-C5C]|nr:AraC family transcriptional regulator [Oscillospiraceae bacterium HV4-5-C5C]
MYKILLADDEGLALDSLAYMINQSWGNQCMTRGAKSGRAVIEAAESFHPEIAIMDIQMPGINGIEAIREIKKFSPDTVFLIISAYDQFDYAQQALALGVISYLTKPLDQDRFTEALQSAMDVVDRQKERRSADLRNREKLETVIPVIESGFIFTLLQGYDQAEVRQYRELLDIHQDYAYMMLIACGESGARQPLSVYPPDQAAGLGLANPIGTGIRIQPYYTRIRNILKTANPQAVVGQIMGNKIPVLIPYCEASMDYKDRTRLVARLQDVVRQLEQKTEAVFRIGIGSVHPCWEIAVSNHEALQSLNTGTEAVSHANDLPVACEYEPDYPLAAEKAIFENLKRGEAAATSQAADYFFKWMENTQQQHPESIRIKALEFVLWAEHLAYEDGGMGVYRFTDRQDYLDITSRSSLAELHRWFTNQITEAARRIATKSSKRSFNIIDQARLWIGQHYMDDISLDDVSRKVNISPYYFSKLFRQEVGITFIEYLTDLRMSKARQLLEAGSLPIRDIGAAVGYQDPNYFSRTFKRLTGMTPSDYRVNIPGYRDSSSG